MTARRRSGSRTGLAGVFCALGAFGSWGLVSPIQFKLIADVPPNEVLAQRILWSAVVVLGLIAILGRWRGLAEGLAPSPRLAWLALSAILVGSNSLVYIVAVNAGRMVEASLGYFLNPLVNVALGVIFLRERLRPLQIAACALAFVGVAVMAVSVGAVPWIALALALTFGFYGLIRKTVPIEPLIGFGVETVILLPAALAYLAYLSARGAGPVADRSGVTIVLLMLTGVTTSAPLILFAAAAQRLKLSTVGLLQYLSPSCLLLLGVLAYGEPFTQTAAVSFAAIWTALALYSFDALGSAVRGR